MIVYNMKKFDYPGFSLEKLDEMYKKDFDVNIIVGGRSNYKTSVVQCKTFKNYFEKGELSIRLFRFEDDTKPEYVEEFFTPFAKKYLLEKYGYTVIYKKRAYYLQKYEEDKIVEEIAYMKIVSLSKRQNFKSNNLEKYTTIWFEEFVPENGIYLKKEFQKLMNFISTVNRNNKDNKLKVILTGNMISVDNLYFSNFGIDAFDLKTSNIYDYTVEGYQRVGVYVVDPVFSNFEDAPRILRLPSHNVQETSQNEYELPDDIIDPNDVFHFLLVNDIEAFNRRFYVNHIIDVTDLNKHICYLFEIKDVFDEKNVYIAGDRTIEDDIYVTYPEDYLLSHTDMTSANSVIEKPVFRLSKSKFCGKNIRQTCMNLVEGGFI